MSLPLVRGGSAAAPVYQKNSINTGTASIPVRSRKKTDKIFDDQKKKYLPALEKALELCKENKMEEARIIMDEMRDHFFQDALTNESQFFGH